MTRRSFSSSSGMCGASARGRSTSTPVVRMGAVTMKITSKTSMTSTSGVTLISERGARPPPPPPLIAMVLQEVPLHDVEVVARERLDLALEDPQLAQEVVIGCHGRDGRDEADRGRDQRLGDAGRDDGEARALLRADVQERAHDAP